MTSPTAVDLTPYSTVANLLGSLEGYLSVVEGQRVASYGAYQAIYWNIPNAFKLVQRGSQSNPIYIPTARTLVDTVDRYVGADFGWTVDALTAPDTEVAVATEAFRALFVRERFLSKFDANKLFGLINGDWCWYILADGDKPEGTRISIRSIDPGMVFKVTDPDDVDKTVGYDLIEKFLDGDKTRLKIQRYTKGIDPINKPDPTDTLIYSSLQIWDLDEYAKGTAGRPVRLDLPLTPLPPQITALPVYHVPNFETPGDPWGSSELRGFEGVLAAVNQSISDEDLALALEGLGIYATDSGAPIDPSTRQPTNWKLGPGRVVEKSTGSSFDRVNGVGSVTPYQDHLDFMINSLKEASGATDAAAGKVDVSVAESGISLVLQLGPMLAKAKKKDTIITDVHAQMFHDLKGWLQAYESINIPTAEVIPTLGQKIPVNKSGEVSDILSIVGVIPQLATIGWAVRQLQKLGYDFTPQEVTALAQQQAADAAAAAAEDRVNAELNSTGDQPADGVPQEGQ
jgi:hypothetical protein